MGLEGRIRQKTRQHACHKVGTSLGVCQSTIQSPIAIILQPQLTHINWIRRIACLVVSRFPIRIERKSEDRRWNGQEDPKPYP
jgi:hypothetical protein